MKGPILGLVLLCALAGLVVGSRIRQNEIRKVNDAPEADPILILFYHLKIVDPSPVRPVAKLQEYLLSLNASEADVKNVKKLADDAARDVNLVLGKLEKDPNSTQLLNDAKVFLTQVLYNSLDIETINLKGYDLLHQVEKLSNVENFIYFLARYIDELDVLNLDSRRNVTALPKDSVAELEYALGIFDVEPGFSVLRVQSYLRSLNASEESIKHVKSVSEAVAKDVLLLLRKLTELNDNYRLLKDVKEFLRTLLLLNFESVESVNKLAHGLYNRLPHKGLFTYPDLEKFIYFLREFVVGLNIFSDYDKSPSEISGVEDVRNVLSFLRYDKKTLINVIAAQLEKDFGQKYAAEFSNGIADLLYNYLFATNFLSYREYPFEVKDSYEVLVEVLVGLVELPPPAQVELRLEQLLVRLEEITILLPDLTDKEISGLIPLFVILYNVQQDKINHELIERLKSNPKSVAVPISKLIQEHRFKRVDADRISNDLVQLLKSIYQHLESDESDINRQEYRVRFGVAKGYLSQFLQGLLELKTDANFDKEFEKVLDNVHQLINNLDQNFQSEIDELAQLSNQLVKLKPDSRLPKRPKVQTYDYLTPVDNFRDDPTYYVPTLAEFLRQQGHRNAISLSNELFDVLYSLLGKLDASDLSPRESANTYGPLGEVLKVLSLYPEYLEQHFEDLLPHLNQLLLALKELRFLLPDEEVTDLVRLKKELKPLLVKPVARPAKRGVKKGSKTGKKSNKRAGALRKRRN